MNFPGMINNLEAMNVHLSDSQVRSFEMYLSLLNEWNSKMDLTALKTDAEIIEKHFYDSLLVSQALAFGHQSLIDIGSGAGLPGIPLKIAFPNLKVTLLEPTHKRCLFLETVVQTLGLKGIEIINARAEEIVREKREHFDIAIARAVAPMNVLLEISVPLVKPHGFFVAMKGPGGDEELTHANQAVKTLSCSLEKVQTTTLVSNGDIRKNIVFRKLSATPRKYPRQYAEIKKNPL